MTPIKHILAATLLASASLSVAPSALAQDEDECRGGYPIMLMTPKECSTYLKQLADVQARSDRLAELDLREWHTALLIERAEACPCKGGLHYALYHRGSGSRGSKIQRY